jgi:hypothetical protein
VRGNEGGSCEGSSDEALPGKFFARWPGASALCTELRNSARWITGLTICKSHTFELLAVEEVQRCEGTVLEGVNVALKWRGGRRIW